MSRERTEILFEKHADASGLPGDDVHLLAEAESAARAAYAPYSRFRVGTAIRLGNGTIVQGSNQENAAYPDGLCAERVAAFHASHAWPDVPFDTVAVAALHGDQPGPVTPCGSCRQALLEIEYRTGQNIRLIMKDADGSIIVSPSIRNLLPFCFSPGHLSPGA